MRWFVLLIFILGACSDPEPDLVGNNGNNRNNGNNENNQNNLNNMNNMNSTNGPSCSDGTFNGDETAIDCGGSCDPCAIGSTCLVNEDCELELCEFGTCYQPCEEIADGDAKWIEWPGFAFQDETTDNSVSTPLAAGVAVVDFDMDGDPDVVTSHERRGLTAWRNDAGSFTDVTDAVGLNIGPGTSTIVFADVDRDGDPDFFVGTITGGALLRNDNGIFSPITAAWGIEQSQGAPDPITSASFADFDNDGFIDLYIGRYVIPGSIPVGEDGAAENKLYRNTGTAFEIVPNPPGSVTGEKGYTLATAWFDFNDDNMPDLWVGNDFGPLNIGNQLYVNLGNGTFQDVAEAAGFDDELFSMTATLGDFDNDGDLDGYTTTFGRNVLFVVENQTATDEATARGAACGQVPDPKPNPGAANITPPNEPRTAAYFERHIDPMQYTATGWGALFFDADHDGWLDLFVPNGQIDGDGWIGQDRYQPNYLHMNSDGMFSQAGCGYFPDFRGTSRGAATGDFDGDGDLDLVWVDNEDGDEDKIIILENQDGRGAWLKVKVEGTTSNTDGIGAVVTATTANGSYIRLIDGGQGYMSSSERVAHFGLADATTVTEVTVKWPNGVVQTVANPTINDTLVVVEQ